MNKNYNSGSNSYKNSLKRAHGCSPHTFGCFLEDSPSGPAYRNTDLQLIIHTQKERVQISAVRTHLVVVTGQGFLRVRTPIFLL